VAQPRPPESEDCATDLDALQCEVVDSRWTHRRSEHLNRARAERPLRICLFERRNSDRLALSIYEDDVATSYVAKWLDDAADTGTS